MAQTSNFCVHCAQDERTYNLRECHSNFQIGKRYMIMYHDVNEVILKFASNTVTNFTTSDL
jgi:hypothetical protein